MAKILSRRSCVFLTLVFVGLLELDACGQIAGGRNDQGQADVWWHVGGSSDEWVSLVLDEKGNNGMPGATVVCSLCTYGGELYAGTDGGRVFKYDGTRTWQLTKGSGDTIRN